MSTTTSHRKPEWRQTCPKNQLISTWSAIEGHRSNFEDGIITAEQFLEKTKVFFEDVSLLSNLVGSGSWEVCK